MCQARSKVAVNVSRWGPVGFEDRMKVQIYEQLFRLNQGFDEILTALAALMVHVKVNPVQSSLGFS